MTALVSCQRRASWRGTGAARRRFFSAEHGEHGEDPPFDTARPWAGITIEEQRRLLLSQGAAGGAGWLQR